MTTEHDLLKKNKSKTAICKICGKEFFPKTKYKKIKYCPNCTIKLNQKKFKHNLTNKQFKELYEIFYGAINTFTKTFIDYKSQYFECVIEQSIVSLWLYWLREFNKGQSINNLKNTNKSLIYFIVKTSYFLVIKHNDIPPTIRGTTKKLEQQEKEALRLDSSQDEENSFIDYIIAPKPPIDKILDLKKFTNQIFMESTIDTDIRAAIIRTELSDISLKTSITEKEKIELIKNEYSLDVKNIAALKRKAINGMYKLYNTYAPEIKEILEITEKQLKFNTSSKKAKNHNFMLPIQRCVICGKAFMPTNNNNNLTCSSECSKTRANQLRNERRAKDRLRTLINQAYNAKTADECFENLEKALKII